VSTKTIPCDPVDFLRDDDAIAAYLTEAFESDDAQVVAQALGTVVSAKGMAQVSIDTGLTREARYRTLSETGPGAHSCLAQDVANRVCFV